MPTLDEYWVDEDDTLIYANGDIGDYNHESIAIQRLLGELINAMKDDDIWGYTRVINEDDELDQYSFGQAIINSIDSMSESMPPEANDDTWTWVANRIGWKRDKVALAVNGTFEGRELCIREWAVVEWNWIRLLGNSVQARSLDKDTLKRIANAMLEQADEEELEREEFYLEFTDLPRKMLCVSWDELSSCDVVGIRKASRLVP